MGFRPPFLSVALICVACGAAHEPPARSAALTTPAHGAAAPLPEVHVLGLDRRPTTLPRLARGRPALINLWATWCDTCEREFDALNRLQARLGDRALVIGVAEGEEYERVLGFLRERPVGFAQVIDERFLLADALGAKHVPMTLVVDRDGIVRHRGGALDGAALEALRAALRD